MGCMENYLNLDGKQYPVEEVIFNLDVSEEGSVLYFGAGSEIGGFGLWGIELSELTSQDCLDCRRIHVGPAGKNYEDDTLGTNIIDAFDMSDLNYWHSEDDDVDDLIYGEIQVDFKLLDKEHYSIKIEICMTESDEDPEDLTLEDYNHILVVNLAAKLQIGNPDEDSC